MGCGYSFPTDAKILGASTITLVDEVQWAEYDAAVYHWVRKSEMGAVRDVEVFLLLRDWLAGGVELREVSVRDQ